jgi:polar amino acid transport system substrate-binding protein
MTAAEMPNRFPSSSAQADDPVLSNGRRVRGARNGVQWLLDCQLARAMTLVIVAIHLLSLPARADELDDIKARGTLIVGVSESSPPFSFRDGEHGIVGYDVDLAAAVAKALGVELRKVPVINAERIPALRDAKVDLVASGMTRSAGRARDIGFSVGYFVSPHKILVRRDSGLARIAQLAGHTLALVRSASVDKDLKAAVPTLQIVLYDDYQAAFTALRDKRVDSFLADELLLLRFAWRSGSPDDFGLIGDYTLPRTAGFGLRQNEPRFKNVVDRTLIDLEASGAAAGIFDKWFAPLTRPFRIKPD